jgi:hypothetical protein
VIVMSEKVYVFIGVATVTVTALVEAKSEAEARKMLGGGRQGSGDVTWECDEVDGDVTQIDLSHVEGE